MFCCFFDPVQSFVPGVLCNFEPLTNNWFQGGRRRLWPWQPLRQWPQMRGGQLRGQNRLWFNWWLLLRPEPSHQATTHNPQGCDSLPHRLQGHEERGEYHQEDQDRLRLQHWQPHNLTCPMLRSLLPQGKDKSEQKKTNTKKTKINLLPPGDPDRRLWQRRWQDGLQLLGEGRQCHGCCLQPILPDGL